MTTSDEKRNEEFRARLESLLESVKKINAIMTSTKEELNNGKKTRILTLVKGVGVDRQKTN